MFYAFLRGFGVEISFLETTFGSTIAVIANALSISGIGNWGTLEAGWTAGFLLGGFPKGESDKKPSFRAPKPWKADKRRAFIGMVQYLLQTFQLNPLTYISFGGLQWIQLEGIFLHFLLDMSGKITRSLCPFDRRLTIGLAIGTRFVCHHSITPFAGLHNGIASCAVIGTAVLFHENTFCTHFDRLTNHDNQPPF